MLVVLLDVWMEAIWEPPFHQEAVRIILVASCFFSIEFAADPVVWKPKSTNHPSFVPLAIFSSPYLGGYSRIQQWKSKLPKIAEPKPSKGGDILAWKHSQFSSSGVSRGLVMRLNSSSILRSEANAARYPIGILTFSISDFAWIKAVIHTWAGGQRDNEYLTTRAIEAASRASWGKNQSAWRWAVCPRWILTMTGPDMKNPSSSTIEFQAASQPLLAPQAQFALREGQITLFQALSK
jgi:hypothetical protein